MAPARVEKRRNLFFSNPFVPRTCWHAGVSSFRELHCCIQWQRQPIFFPLPCFELSLHRIRSRRFTRPRRGRGLRPRARLDADRRISHTNRSFSFTLSRLRTTCLMRFHPVRFARALLISLPFAVLPRPGAA